MKCDKVKKVQLSASINKANGALHSEEAAGMKNIVWRRAQQ
jgi:hypothetical protein